MKDKKTLTEIDKILTEFNFDRLSFDEAKERLFSLLHPPQTDVLDELQKHSSGYSNGWICRLSSSGRGLRIHETTRKDAMLTIMEAIKKYLSEHPKAS